MGPEEVLTFLMTDVVGSSRLAEQEPGKYLELLRAHDVLIRKVVSSSGGNCIRERGEGDSTFSVFTNPDDAIDCAVKIVELLRRDLPEISLRQAVHSGIATPVDHDYRGDAPNRCARIRSLAHPGQILVSGVTAALARRKSHLVQIGKVALKGLSEKVEIFQVRLDESDHFPKVRGLAKHNLPPLIAPLVPRPRLVSDLLETCQSYRLVVLEGVVGVGKSTLLQLAGREALDTYPGGVWWISPSDGSSVSFLERLAHTMSIEIGAGTDLFLKLVAHLGSDKAMVLVDGVSDAPTNFQQEGHRLLEAIPSLRVVVTADKQLDLVDAKRFVVPPMRTDRSGEALDYAYRRLDQLGISLPSDREAERELGQLLETLGGLPLAIELILPRLQVMSPAQVSARLQTLVSRSTKSQSGGSTPKYESVRSAILASLDGLSAEAQLLAKELAILPGAFDLETVVELFASDDRDEFDLAEQVQEIVRASLIQFKKVGSVSLFEWLPVVRLSLENKSVVQTGFQQRLLTWASTRACKFLSGGISEQLVESWFPNLKWVLSFVATDESADEIQTVLRAMRRIWFVHGPVAEALETHSLMEQRLTTPGVARADVLNGLGIFHWYSGDHALARDFYAGALRLWEAASDERGQAISLNNLGLLALSRMDFSEAREAFVRSREILENTSHAHLLLIAKQNLAATELRMEPGSIMIDRWQALLLECREDDLGRLNLLSNLFESSVLGKQSDEAILGWLRLIHMEGNRWVDGPGAITILCSLALWLSQKEQVEEDPLLCVLLVKELSKRTGMVLDSTHQTVLSSASVRTIPDPLVPEFESVAEVRWAAIDIVESVLLTAAGGLIKALEF